MEWQWVEWRDAGNDAGTTTVAISSFMAKSGMEGTTGQAVEEFSEHRRLCRRSMSRCSYQDSWSAQSSFLLYYVSI